MNARDAFRRFLRGLLLFLLGIVIGGAFVYLAFVPSSRTPPQPAATTATTTAATPAAPAPVSTTAPATQAPALSSAQPNALPETPPGQFDAKPEPVTATAQTPALASRLLIPVQGVQASQLVDTFTQARGDGRVHDAIDIMAPAGTPVLAAADGTVAKLFDSKLGGTTLYEFDTSGTLAYYYAHLQSYAPGIAEGKALKQGEVIGYVGSTGNANPTAPHLHFAIFVLGPDKHWWQGTAINPYPLLATNATR